MLTHAMPMCASERENKREKVHATVERWFAHCDIYTVLQHAVMLSQNTECIKMSDSTCHVEN